MRLPQRQPRRTFGNARRERFRDTGQAVGPRLRALEHTDMTCHLAVIYMRLTIYT
jgi:hypothetical protein